MIMNYDYTLAALATAVLMLGVVTILELRTVVKLRRTVTRDLERVFEQLDLLRFESNAILDNQKRPVRLASAPAPIVAAALNHGAVAVPSPSVVPFNGGQGRLAAGEARVLVALQNRKER
ncbi:MAG: hypothetical protein QM718_12420 [Steroidobacteraceae bacterium]